MIGDLRASGLPSPWQHLKLAEGLTNFGPDERLAEASKLLDISADEARRYFSENDTYSLEVVVFRNKLLYRKGEKARADSGFADWIGRNREFIATIGADGRGVNDFIRAMTLYEAMLYRGFYAYERCDKPQAASQWRQAQDLAGRAFGADDNRRKVVGDMLADLGRGRRVQLPTVAGSLSANESRGGRSNSCNG